MELYLEDGKRKAAQASEGAELVEAGWRREPHGPARFASEKVLWNAPRKGRLSFLSVSEVFYPFWRRARRSPLQHRATHARRGAVSACGSSVDVAVGNW